MPTSRPYLVEADDGLRMDADDVQTPTVALQQLCKQAEENSPDLLVLCKGMDSAVRRTKGPRGKGITFMCQDQPLLNRAGNSGTS